MLDTSFYIEHPEKIESVDFHQLVGRSEAVKVLIPIVVVDELDGLKKSPRLGYTLAFHVLPHGDRQGDRRPPSPGILFPRQDNPPRGGVALEIVFDSLGHVRLTVADDEIVDRSGACQPYAGPVTVVTYDTGQSRRRGWPGSMS